MSDYLEEPMVPVPVTNLREIIHLTRDLRQELEVGRTEWLFTYIPEIAQLHLLILKFDYIVEVRAAHCFVFPKEFDLSTEMALNFFPIPILLDKLWLRLRPDHAWQLTMYQRYEDSPVKGLAVMEFGAFELDPQVQHAFRETGHSINLLKAGCTQVPIMRAYSKLF